MANLITNWAKQYEDSANSTRTIRIEQGKNGWYTQNLRDLKLKYIAATNELERKKLRNHYVSEIRRAKRHHQRQFIEKYRSKGGVWKLLRKPQSSNDFSLSIDGVHTVNKKQIAEEFKNTFTSKVKKLRKKPNAEEIMKSLKQRLGEVEKWDLRECTFEEVAKCIDKLKYSASTGPDGVSNRTIKHLKFEIITPLMKLINCSIKAGKFPRIWKSSRVCPVFKHKGSKEDANNYTVCPVCPVTSFCEPISRVLKKIERKHNMPRKAEHLSSQGKKRF